MKGTGAILVRWKRKILERKEVCRTKGMRVFLQWKNEIRTSNPNTAGTHRLHPKRGTFYPSTTNTG